jgi:phage protein D
MTDSPSRKAQGLATLTLRSNGIAIDASIGVVSVEVRRAVNAAPSARIEILDGDAATGAWPVSDGAGFAPGAAITILAGYDGQQEPIFEGLVVKVGIRSGGNGDGRLVVECRGKAVSMAGARHGAHHAVHDGTPSVGAPDLDGTPVLKVEYGVDLVEFRAEIDARTEPDATAGAEPNKAGRSRVCGHLRFQGSAKALPGALIEVKGLGKRYDGKVSVVAVEHQIADGGWFTRAEFGPAAGGSIERSDAGASDL